MDNDRKMLELLLGSDRRSRALVDELLADYKALPDMLDDYRIDRLPPTARGLVMVARDLATSRLKRKQGRWRRNMASTSDAGEFFLTWFAGMDHEELAALYLDEELRIIDCVTESSGNRYSVSLDVRGVIRRALTLEAKYVIIAHNHPDALALPSPDDIYGTTMVSWTARASGIELLDHIVVYHSDFVSLYESGLMSTDRRISDAELHVTDGRLELRLGPDGTQHGDERGGVYYV